MTDRLATQAEIDTWRTINGFMENRDWANEWGKALPHQLESHEARIKRETERACGEFDLIGPDQYPNAEEGVSRPPASEGRMYYDDWFTMMERASSAQYLAEGPIRPVGGRVEH